MRPYIGICDFLDYDQVVHMTEVFVKHLPPKSNRMLHVGTMMSYKTLNDIPNRWQNIFPPKEKLKSIFASDHPLVYNCLHYADYDDQPGLSESLATAIMYGGERLHALQLDMPWPDPDQVQKGVTLSGKKVEVILQIGKRSFEELDNSPEKIINRLKSYDGVVERVLLDKSMGQGIGMDAEGLIPFARAIMEKFPKIGIVAAGGLGPTSTHLVKPLLKVVPGLSWDAQSKLRPSGNAKDPIDWNMAGDYLVESLSLV